MLPNRCSGCASRHIKSLVAPNSIWQAPIELILDCRFAVNAFQLFAASHFAASHFRKERYGELLQEWEDDGSRNFGWGSFLAIAIWSTTNLAILVVTLEATWVAVSYLALFGGGSLVVFFAFHEGNCSLRAASFCAPQSGAFPFLQALYWTVILTDAVPPTAIALSMYPVGAVLCTGLFYACGTRFHGAPPSSPCYCLPCCAKLAPPEGMNKLRIRKKPNGLNLV